MGFIEPVLALVDEAHRVAKYHHVLGKQRVHRSVAIHARPRQAHRYDEQQQAQRDGVQRPGIPLLRMRQGAMW